MGDEPQWGQWLDTGMALTPLLEGSPLDPHPDRCWRCDARPSRDDLGLCEPCREVLT